MSGVSQNTAKLQAEREMMGCVVSTPPARRQVNRADVFPLNPVAVEAVATKKERFLPGDWAPSLTEGHSNDAFEINYLGKPSL